MNILNTLREMAPGKCIHFNFYRLEAVKFKPSFRDIPYQNIYIHWSNCVKFQKVTSSFINFFLFGEKLEAYLRVLYILNYSIMSIHWSVIIGGEESYCGFIVIIMKIRAQPKCQYNLKLRLVSNWSKKSQKLRFQSTYWSRIRHTSKISSCNSSLA